MFLSTCWSPATSLTTPRVKRAKRPEHSEMNELEMQHISHVCTQSTWNFYSQELLFKRTKRLKIRKIGLLMYENVTAVFTSTVSLVHLSCILLKFHVGEETGLQIGSRFFKNGHWTKMLRVLNHQIRSARQAQPPKFLYCPPRILFWKV